MAVYNNNNSTLQREREKKLGMRRWTDEWQPLACMWQWFRRKSRTLSRGQDTPQSWNETFVSLARDESELITMCLRVHLRVRCSWLARASLCHSRHRLEGLHPPPVCCFLFPVSSSSVSVPFSFIISVSLSLISYSLSFVSSDSRFFVLSFFVSLIYPVFFLSCFSFSLSICFFNSFPFCHSFPFSFLHSLCFLFLSCLLLSLFRVRLFIH